MTYILIGDSGTVSFEDTGIVTGETVKLSSKVTDNPIEDGSSISDHVFIEPINLDLSGIVASESEYTLLDTMWKNRELLSYRGGEALDNLLITSLSRSRDSDNSDGYSFSISFRQITLSTSTPIALKNAKMSEQDKGKKTSAEAQSAVRPTAQGGMIALSSEQAASVPAVAGTNFSVGVGRTNPGYPGF